MLINADFSQRCVINTKTAPWVPSPQAGVERVLLDRNGGEVARATSLVRYAAGSTFTTHEHGAGEEFLVLEGVFADEHGEYPAGTYVRNPPGSRHAPFSRPGCVIFVKLRQFHPEDLTRVVIDTRVDAWRTTPEPGVSLLPLHAFGTEHVALHRLEPGTRCQRHIHERGEELLVLSGTFADEQGSYPAGTWVRNPPGSANTPFSDDGCLVFVKSGHLGPTGG